MNSYPITIKPFGEEAILVEWPNEVKESILEDILQFGEHLRINCLEADDWEMIPAYNSLTLINLKESIDFNKTTRELKLWYQEKIEANPVDRFLWKLPVYYNHEFGMDLEEVSELLGKTIEETISLHTKNNYTVYGIGFLPGFMYLGGLPKIVETPRKSTPRLKVPKGSVGLAGKQTGIYPQESPGGWNIIGNCPIPIFDVEKEAPCFVSVGDKIQFYPISKGEYELYKIQAEVGIYKIEKIKLHA